MAPPCATDAVGCTDLRKRRSCSETFCVSARIIARHSAHQDDDPCDREFRACLSGVSAVSMTACRYSFAPRQCCFRPLKRYGWPEVEASGSSRVPIAFYVRQLNPGLTDFDDVERFFREVVDPTVAGLGYRRVEMGTDASRHGFMNVEIFETLHYADMVVVDVTGQRPNCFIELGYALGRGARIIVTAKQGTPLPFDQQAIPCFFWSPGTPAAELERDFAAFIGKNLNRPTLVK